MSDIDTLELECGVTLEFQAMNPMLLLDLLEGLKKDDHGNYSIGGLKKMSLRSLNRLMRVICGWGIKNDVPPDDVDDFAMFGDGKRLQRSAWVRAIATRKEFPEILGRVMALTRMSGNPKQEPTPEQQELELLRAENEQLKAQKEDGD